MLKIKKTTFDNGKLYYLSLSLQNNAIRIMLISVNRLYK